MKKLIAISVVFALVVGAAFAVDLGGEVIGTVYVLKGDSGEDSKVTGSAALNRVRLDGSGQNEEGTFGGYIRAEAGGFDGNAWWKPIDQLKLWIGGNGGDGFFAKEGYTGWMFYQRASDTGVTMDGGNVWGNGWWHFYNKQFFNTRSAFYGGGIDGADAFYATISPADIVDINIELPFFMEGPPDANGDPTDPEVADVFKSLVAQVSFNFDFGNIALTYAGDASPDTNGKAYVYFNLGSVENLSLDVGVGLTLPGEDEVTHPLAAGLGVKYDVNDAFGLKARVVASFAGDDEQFGLIGDVLPYFALSDTLKVFFSAGLGMTNHSDWDDPLLNWHINPFVWVGQEWGPSFWAGIKIYGFNEGVTKTDKSLIKWEVPIAIGLSF